MKNTGRNYSHKFDDRSKKLRSRIVEVLGAAGRGHVGSSLSLVEMLRVLYDDVLRYKPDEPRWPGRDRFILSKGHGCVAHYVLLQEKGFFPEDELYKFCRFDGILGGHPDPKVPGIEVSTGALGHGLSIGVGMAIRAKRESRDTKVYVVLGDGECNEGSIWEAAMSAAKHKLDNLVVMVDYNKQQSYGNTSEILELEPFREKWLAFGFDAIEINGHDVGEILGALTRSEVREFAPVALICNTVKGSGIDFAENNLNWHHKSKISNEDVRLMQAAVWG